MIKKLFLILAVLAPVIGWGQCESINIYFATENISNEINGQRNGYIVPSVHGNGTAPYTYSWSHDKDSLLPNYDNPAGSYTITVTDNNGCTGDTTYTLTNETYSYSSTLFTTNPRAYTGIPYIDTIFIDNIASIPSSGNWNDSTIYAFKRGVDFSTQDRIIMLADYSAITSYHTDTTVTDLPILFDSTDASNYSVYSAGINNYVGDVFVRAVDSTYALGNSGSSCLGIVVDTINKYGTAWVNNVRADSGLRNMVLAGKGSLCGSVEDTVGWSEVYISNFYGTNAQFDGIYAAYFKYLSMYNVRVDTANLNYLENIGGDNYQSEAIDSVTVNRCTFDHSYTGGKFAFIANGAKKGVNILNSVLIGHHIGDDATTIYGGACVDGVNVLWNFENCLLVGGDRGYWPHEGFATFTNCVLTGHKDTDSDGKGIILLTAAGNRIVATKCTFYDNDRGLGDIIAGTNEDRITRTPFVDSSLFVDNTYSVYPAIYQPSLVYPDSADKVTANAFQNSPVIGSDSLEVTTNTFIGNYYYPSLDSLNGYGARLDTLNLGYSTTSLEYTPPSEVDTTVVDTLFLNFASGTDVDTGLFYTINANDSVVVNNYSIVSVSNDTNNIGTIDGGYPSGVGSTYIYSTSAGLQEITVKIYGFTKNTVNIDYGSGSSSLAITGNTYISVDGVVYDTVLANNNTVVYTIDTIPVTGDSIEVVVSSDNNNNVLNSLVVYQYDINVCDTTTIEVSGTVVNDNGTNNGSITLSVSGGESPYSYLWTPGDSVSKDITNLSSGAYTVVTTDNNSCKDTSQFIVFFVPEFSLDTINYNIHKRPQQWADIINKGINAKNYTVEPDMDTLVVPSTWQTWYGLTNDYIQEFPSIQNDTLIYGTDNLGNFIDKANAAIKLTE